MTIDPGHARPFLSVILRPGRDAPEWAKDTLLSLAAQTSSDFEVLVMLQDSQSSATADGFRALVTSFPAAFTRRVRLVGAAVVSPAGALAEGSIRARGRYLATMDVPDVAFGNWVETFQEAARSDDKVLRSIPAVQPFDVVRRGDTVAFVSTEKPRVPWPTDYDAMDLLLRRVASPGTLGLALPTEVVAETAPALAFQPRQVGDWATSLRTTLIAGARQVEKVVYLRRSLPGHDADSPTPSEEEWLRGRLDVLNSLAAHSVSLPSRLLGELLNERAQVEHLAERNAALDQALASLRRDLAERDSSIADLLASTSWRLSKPIRQAGTFVRTRSHPR